VVRWRDQRTVVLSNERFLLNELHLTSVFRRTKAARGAVLKDNFLLTTGPVRWSRQRRVRTVIRKRRVRI